VSWEDERLRLGQCAHNNLENRKAVCPITQVGKGRIEGGESQVEPRRNRRRNRGKKKTTNIGGTARKLKKYDGSKQWNSLGHPMESSSEDDPENKTTMGERGEEARH